MFGSNQGTYAQEYATTGYVDHIRPYDPWIQVESKKRKYADTFSYEQDWYLKSFKKLRMND